MTSQLTRIVALSALLAPCMANAVGFGEITLRSRIGEALMAEVPIIHNSEEAPVAACFSMLALRGTDFPVVTAAKPRLIRRGQAYILQLIGNKPVNEPIFAIGLRAGCGYDIEREYVLMPEAPMALPQTVPPPDVQPSAGKAGRSTTWLAREGDTLEDIVDAQAPATPAERQRLLGRLQKANPDLSIDQPLSEGTRVRLSGRQPPSRPTAASAEQTTLPATAAQAHKPRPTPAAPPIARPRGADRLLLGAPPEENTPNKLGNNALAGHTETDERLLKLETTLHLLTQEVAKLDQALDLASKAIEAQNQLQLAQSLKAPPAAGPRLGAAPSGTQPPRSNWSELAISAAVGAFISVGMAQFLGRRRRYPGEEEVPLAFSGYRREASPRMAEREAVQAPQSIAPEPRQSPEPVAEDFPVPQLPECDIPLAPEPEVIEARDEDEHSVLALAEIMLSFGRLKGATETLAEHIEQAMPASIAPWSMLLDLYRRGGMRPEFETLAGRIHDRFNVEVADWNDSTTPISGLKTLEDYPHIVQKATLLWDTQDGVDYLHGLVHDTRTGLRNGFPLEVVEEIALLLGIQEEGYGLKRRGS